MIGEMFMYYVAPEWRGTLVSRSLVEASVEQYKVWGCKRAYAEAASGLEDPRALKYFNNLWAKFGYREIGTVVMRSF
jgi:GNAT superfamily N-acetyltransferase